MKMLATVLVTTTACLIAVLVAGSLVAESSDTKPKLTTRWELGPDTSVPPFDIGEAEARCPRGYVATGGGIFNGAIEPVTDGPASDGKGWEASGFNPSDSSYYDFSVIVECAKGNSALRVRASSADDRRKQAVNDFLEERAR